MKLFVLTGGVAAGKTTAVQLLREHGCVVLDSDEITHDLQRDGQTAFKLIESRFPAVVKQQKVSGDGGKDGAAAECKFIDRDALAAIVFEQSDAGRKSKRDLEHIMQPLIVQRLLREIVAHWLRDGLIGGQIVIVDAPTIFEMHRALGPVVGTLMLMIFSGIVVVSATAQQQLARLTKRNNFTEAEAQRRVASQLSLAEKEERADHVIRNDGDMAQLKEQVAAAHRYMSGKSAIFGGWNSFIAVSAVVVVTAVAGAVHLVLAFFGTASSPA